MIRNLPVLILAAVLLQAAPPKVQIKSLTCPKLLTSGQAGTCVITLTGKAPKGGSAFKITLKDNSTLLHIPAINVIVPQGKTSVSFEITQL